jgi:hypothetical protein
MELQNGLPVLKVSSGVIQSRPDQPFSPLEIKLVFITYGHAYDNLLSNKEHRIHIDELNKYFGFKGNNWDRYNKAFQTLQNTFVSWDIFNYGKKKCTEKSSWVRVQYLGRVGWDSKTKEFVYTYDDQLAKKLYQPEFYALISEYIIIRKLKKQATILLYLQCKLYVDCPNGTRQYEIEELKDVLQIERSMYDTFKIFNNKVIKPAIKKINEVSDIYITPSFIKLGRKVKFIKFVIKRQSNYDFDDEIDVEMNASIDQQKEIKPLCDQLTSSQTQQLKILVDDFGVKEDKAKKIIKSYDNDRIRAAIDYVNKKAGHKLNRAGYVISAIEQNYMDVKNNANKRAVEEEGKVVNNLSMYDLEDTVNNIRSSYFIYCSSLIMSELYKLNSLKTDEFVAKFKQRNMKILEYKKEEWEELNSFGFIEYLNQPIFSRSLYECAIDFCSRLKEELVDFSFYVNGLDDERKYYFQQLNKIHPEKCELFVK